MGASLVLTSMLIGGEELKQIVQSYEWI